jgi:NAD(P)-dependent dehydrogenase (short-subunit alcohol dehydrogenase family)
VPGRISVPGVLTRRGLLKGQLAAGAGYLAAAGQLGGGVAAAASPTLTLHPNFYPVANFTPAIDLRGKVAVITGASSGIGRATGEALAAHGVHVIGTSRDVASVHRPPKFPLLDLDIANTKSANAFVTKLRRRLGRKGHVDIVINNAGRGIVGNPVPPASGASRYFQRLDLAVRTDYSGHVMMTERLRPFLPARGYARVYFTVSIDAYSVSTNAMTLFHGYTSMKRALLAFANAWWSQLQQAHSHIGVATVNPYLVDTRFPDNILLLERARQGSKLAAYVQGLKRAFAGSLPPSLVGQAYWQLLSSAQPPVNVAAGSAAEPYASRGTNSLFELELRVENAQAAVRFEAR